MFRIIIGSKLVLPLVLLSLILVAVVSLAFAGRSDNAEGGQESPLSKSNTVEVGQFSGESQTNGESKTNGEGQIETQVSTFVAEEIELQENPDMPQAQLFQFIAGSNFQPRDSDIAFSYRGAGCLVRGPGAGDSWFTIDLQLPEGAVLDFLRIFYYDNSSTYDINSELWAFDGAGGTELLAEADSSGMPGYSSTGSGSFSHVVNNVNESLVIVASVPEGAGFDLGLCGARVRYQYSPFINNYLPTVQSP